MASCLTLNPGVALEGDIGRPILATPQQAFSLSAGGMSKPLWKSAVADSGEGFVSFGLTALAPPLALTTELLILPPISV